MCADSSEQYPPITLVMHVYVANVDEIFNKAIDAGCEIMEKPNTKPNELDRRGTFKDFAGNSWSVGTQQGSNSNDTNSRMTKLQIAKAFSGEQFDKVMDYITIDTKWNHPGEQNLNGKDEIEPFCKKVSQYFNSITTEFIQDTVIENDHCVSINGTAKFISMDQPDKMIFSCDVYEFDNSNNLLSITSYCIPDKKEKD
jgi:hypothetical protein